jgi:hypothetical protein
MNTLALEIELNYAGSLYFGTKKFDGCKTILY